MLAGFIRIIMYTKQVFFEDILMVSTHEASGTQGLIEERFLIDVNNFQNPALFFFKCLV